MNSLAQQQGMTLLELLVASAVMAVVAGLAFLSLDNLASAKQTLDQHNRVLNQQNLALYWLQNDLQLANTNLTPGNASDQAEFTGDSQGFSLLRFQSPTVPSGRETRGADQQADAHGLVRVRWYVRNNHWYRATQSAFAPLSSSQWLERSMMPLQSVSCQYRNQAGLMQSIWPQEANQRQQLPQRIICSLTQEAGQRTVLDVVPWQHVGFL